MDMLDEKNVEDDGFVRELRIHAEGS
ncbi:hypothetical protein M0804_009334 [Polistes exclamans]|nr:hypothetical protein M0804_009334 [Polistes exclamans]